MKVGCPKEVKSRVNNKAKSIPEVKSKPLSNAYVASPSTALFLAFTLLNCY
jgi:hypothetical protein